MKVYYYDYNFKTGAHALKVGEATKTESGAVKIRLPNGRMLEREAGEWLSEAMFTQDVKRVVYQACVEKIKEELKEENETV